MTTGKALGKYSLKAVTMAFTPGPAGSVVVHANFEGTADGFGTVCQTMTAVPAGQPNGTWESCAVSFPADGNSVTGLGRGTFSLAGANRWRLQGHYQMSDGSVVHTDGELDLASKTWSGTMYAPG